VSIVFRKVSRKRELRAPFDIEEVLPAKRKKCATVDFNLQSLGVQRKELSVWNE
jgi:hypothetical protein